MVTTTDPTYRIRAAAALSGVKEELIRAWERRYGILSPQRTPGGYRVYTQEDINILRRLKQLTEAGVSIAEAARLLPQLKAEAQGPRGDGGVVAPEASSSLDGWRSRILTAASNHDQRSVEQVLDEAFAILPPLRILDGLIMPVMKALGDGWKAGQVSVAQEHLVSQVVRVRLGNILHSAPHGTRRHVVAACFPDEDHDMGLLCAAIRFRYEGWRVTMLGARVPVDEVAAVCRALRPDRLALSCVNDPGRPLYRTQLAGLMKAAGRGVSVVVGGRASELHDTAVRELGAQLIMTPEEWRQTLE